jgi:biopolymer transport protein ExbB
MTGKQFAAALAFINSGGPVNWIIVGLYLITLAVFSERLVYFFRTRYSRNRFFESLRTGAKNHPPKTYTFLRRGIPSQPEQMAAVFLDNLEEEGPLLSERLDREGTKIGAEMEKGQGVLSFITTAAPLLGLLGTITGLMNAFSEIERRGAVADIAFLSGGIREAMITTASGLVTAIFASCCGRWFEYMAARRLRDTSVGLSLLTDQFRRDLLSLPAAKPEGQKQNRESA